MTLSFCKRQGCPCIDAEGDDEHRLNSVDDKHEPEGLLVGNTIENQHGLDGKVPGTGTVGRRNDDSEVCYDKRYKGTTNTQVGGEVEAEKREVKM